VRRTRLACITLLFASLNAQGADDHAACNTVTYNWFDHSSDELRHIASTCESGYFSELNFHRAYYIDLVNEATATAGLIDYVRTENRANLSAYKFHMMLAEQLARHLYPTRVGQLLFLNGEYEVNNEIAELRLRGYNNLADRLSALQSRREQPD